MTARTLVVAMSDKELIECAIQDCRDVMMGTELDSDVRNKLDQAESLLDEALYMATEFDDSLNSGGSTEQ